MKAFLQGNGEDLVKQGKYLIIVYKYKIFSHPTNHIRFFSRQILIFKRENPPVLPIKPCFNFKVKSGKEYFSQEKSREYQNLTSPGHTSNGLLFQNIRMINLCPHFFCPGPVILFTDFFQQWCRQQGGNEQKYLL
jgi:hypothetical protein